MSIIEPSHQNPTKDSQELKAWIFDIQRYSINDGPGIRTTVFFKGCPLRCLWCDNPESQLRIPQLFFFESMCVQCHRCVSVCPNDAITVNADNSITTDRERCNACGTCTVVCPNDARIITGKLMGLEEVLDIINLDALFYRNSNGGITASGGEAATQPEFLIEMFKRCQEVGIHTALDTTGYIQGDKLEQILEYTDLVLLDIKHIDPVIHKELTGVDNTIILGNTRKIAKSGKPVWIRYPLIPGCNDSETNISATGDFVTSLNIKEIDILPYHRLGAGKYQRLGLEYPLPDAKPYSDSQISEIKAMLEAKGLEVKVA